MRCWKASTATPQTQPPPLKQIWRAVALMWRRPSPSQRPSLRTTFSIMVGWREANCPSCSAASQREQSVAARVQRQRSRAPPGPLQSAAACRVYLARLHACPSACWALLTPPPLLVALCCPAVLLAQARQGSVPAVEELLSEQGDPNVADPVTGETPLFAALEQAAMGEPELLTLLLSRKSSLPFTHCLRWSARSTSHLPDECYCASCEMHV